MIHHLRDWLEERLQELPGRLPTVGVIRYVLNHWDGLTRFLDDGRLELDTNSVERAIRPIALNRKNALFAGGDEGGETCATIAHPSSSACKLQDVEPNAYLTDVLTRLVNGERRLLLQPRPKGSPPRRTPGSRTSTGVSVSVYSVGRGDVRLDHQDQRRDQDRHPVPASPP